MTRNGEQNVKRELVTADQVTSKELLSNKDRWFCFKKDKRVFDPKQISHFQRVDVDNLFAL